MLNFIPIKALHTVASLKPIFDLRELHLLGNPCTTWKGYRQYVICTLPQLRSLDGQEISKEERQQAAAEFESLENELNLLIEKANQQFNSRIEDGKES